VFFSILDLSLEKLIAILYWASLASSHFARLWQKRQGSMETPIQQTLGAHTGE
jgi:hypothetical protein